MASPIFHSRLCACFLLLHTVPALKVNLQEYLVNSPTTPPFIFYVIDTNVGGQATAFRDAARQTWLTEVRAQGDDYRFFGFDTDRVLDTSAHGNESDYVVVTGAYPKQRHAREFATIRFGLKWALDKTKSNYIAKVDHDTFICAGHLHHDMLSQGYPREKMFMGYFWSNGQGCRADQNFLVYTRDVLQHAVAELSGPLCNPICNWAFGWMKVMAEMWRRGELRVINEALRFDSQQGWHDGARLAEGESKGEVFPRAGNIFDGYCGKKVGIHVLTKDTAVFHAIMRRGGASAPSYDGVPPEAMSPPKCLK